MADYSTVDAALEVLGGYGPDLANGLTSHAPMVVEALAAMGRADAISPWIDTYRAGMLPAPRAREPITPDAWRAVLGREDRVADWFVFFERELARTSSWEAVLERWVPHLAPAACASATHGIIRTGHAVRSLAERETLVRRRELAYGLGYWAAAYQTLPVARTVTQPTGSVEEALARVPVVPPAERIFTGTIVSSLVGLDRFPPFAAVVHLLDTDANPGAILSDLTHTFAQVFLDNAVDTLSTIVFVHGVTSVAAVRSLVPHLPDGLGRDVVRYAWQASAALYATFARACPDDRTAAPAPGHPDRLIDGAIACGDEHAIKFTEACLREHALRPSDVFLAAAHHAIDMLAAH